MTKKIVKDKSEKAPKIPATPKVQEKLAGKDMREVSIWTEEVKRLKIQVFDILIAQENLANSFNIAKDALNKSQAKLQEVIQSPSK